MSFTKVCGDQFESFLFEMKSPLKVSRMKIFWLLSEKTLTKEDNLNDPVNYFKDDLFSNLLNKKVFDRSTI